MRRRTQPVSVPDLAHIRWLGGGTGAGKTTIARLLAKRSGVPIYSTDMTFSAHGSELGPIVAPRLDRFRQMSMDERWVVRDPAEMYRTFPWFHGEGFELLVEDLRRLPADRIVLVEGFRLLPDLVRPLLCDSRAAVWLIPTRSFRQAAFAARERVEAFWRRTSDPERALHNLLARDDIFTTEIAAAASRDGLRTVAIDGSRDAVATAAAIADQFGL
jgi:hypothetical protein